MCMNEVSVDDNDENEGDDKLRSISKKYIKRKL